MSKAQVRQISTDRLTTIINGASKLHGAYVSVKSEYDRLESLIGRIEQVGGLIDPNSRAKTLVDLAVEGTYAIAEKLSNAASALPVVAVFKAYHETHFKVLAECVQAMSDHSRAQASLNKLQTISQTVRRDSPDQIRNFSAALQDQRQAARSEVAVLRVFRPAGYHATGIMERVFTQVALKGSDTASAQAFPQRSAAATRQIGQRVAQYAEYQKGVDESLRDNRDLVLHQLTEVLAAATVYRGLLWRALAISQAIDSKADAAGQAGGMSALKRISASVLGMTKDVLTDRGEILDVASLRKADDDWKNLVRRWQQFSAQLLKFQG